MNGQADSGSSESYSLGVARVTMWLALAIHVADEELTGFLPVYNATVVALRARLGVWPMPVFDFNVWLTGLVVGISGLALLSPFAFRGTRWIRPLLLLIALVTGLLNAAGHTLATVLGHTVSTVQFARPAPGFWSSPLLAAASIYALVQLWRTRRRTVRALP